jgi:hypothetical protein
MHGSAHADIVAAMVSATKAPQMMIPRIGLI